MENAISKPLNDKCNYATFQLNNKLNVFLVEDPDTDVACGTMLVKIGHDHDTVLGIAHFLEHMLFNGTTKYPDENEYSAYINKNGGINNAYTDHDHTCYFFTIQPDCLEHSLDMFGNFFISPLLNPDSVDREKNAVNSEHIKNITNDGWRLQEIVRQAMDKTNPLSNFGTGSARTLAIPDIDKKVRDFFENHYSSHLMTLFVVTKNNMENIKSKITDVFSQIKLKYTPENMRYFGNKIYNYPQTIKVVPLKQMEKLSISWDLPSYKHCPLRSPYHFLSHIIGHEGKNTIHYLLCQLGYITNLSSGTEIHSNDRCTFTVSVMMTPMGSKNKENILFTIIKYIELMKSQIHSAHLENLYDEQMTLDAFEFKYSIKTGPTDRTLEYVRLVNNYDFNLDDMLILPYAKENFVPNVKSNLIDVLNNMTIDKSVVVIVSNSYNGLTNLVDEDYGTEYNISNEHPDLNNADIDVSLLDLPNINRFISIEDSLISESQQIPVKLEAHNIELYYLPTNEFRTPDVNVRTTILFPSSMKTVEEYVKTQLYFSSLLSEINYESYMCSVANYKVDTYFDNGKLDIVIFGNYGKIKEICQFLVDSLLNKNLITEKIFNTSVYGLKMASTNAVLSPPFKRTNSYFQKTACSIYYDNSDILATLNGEGITMNNVKSVIDQLLEVSACKILVSGNCTDKLAKDVAEIFGKFVVNNSCSLNDVVFDTYFPPLQSQTLIKKVENSFETNTAVMYNVFLAKLRYGKTNEWDKQICMLNILDSVMSTEYFDQVRTKDGFGYIVYSSKKTYGSTIDSSKYYSFVVQSPHKTPEEIIQRTEKFIVEYRSKLSTLTETELYEIVDALISQLDAPFNNLEEMSSFVFEREICAELYSFNLKRKLIDTYRNVTIGDIVKFYDDKFMNDKVAIVVGLVGNKSE